MGHHRKVCEKDQLEVERMMRMRKMWEGCVHVGGIVWIDDRGCGAGVVAVGDACPGIGGKHSGGLGSCVVPWEPIPMASLDQ